MSEKVVVRMAPSPTGNLHVGTARTTLFNYLFARQSGGKFILRIDDTDVERSTKAFEQNILDGLAWLGLSHDESFRQSERTSIYVSYLQRMIDSGSAYVSKEEVKEEGQRSEVIRLKNPNKKVVFDDLIRGQVEFDTTDLGDFIVAKSLEEPLYHLASVVDDIEMGITHVIRGEDGLSNTPRQILLQEALGASRPVYAHLPLLLGADRSKLSKRKHGEIVWIDTYKNKGCLPEAMVNYLALLGWNPGTDQEIFTLEELIKEFDIKKIQKGGAIFDEKKLDWVNKEHIKLLSPDEQRKLLLKSIENEPYITGEPTLKAEEIPWKNISREETISHLEKVSELVRAEESIMLYAESAGKGNVLWPLRYSLSGAKASPDPLTLLEILGQEKALKRIAKAIELLKE